MALQTKRLAFDAAEVKLFNDDMSFTGYASVFGGTDSYGDTIDPKAFDKTIKRGKSDRPIRLRWNHFGPVIGKFRSLGVDDKGLRVEGELTPGHSVAQDVFASMKHGAVDGLSIGYIPKKIEMLSDNRRLLKEVELVEISVVEEPADKAARIDLKSAIVAAKSLKDV
jgi:HK97 family phage prohead protease